MSGHSRLVVRLPSDGPNRAGRAAVRGPPPLREGVVRPQRTTQEKGEGPPLSRVEGRGTPAATETVVDDQSGKGHSR